MRTEPFTVEYAVGITGCSCTEVVMMHTLLILRCTFFHRSDAGTFVSLLLPESLISIPFKFRYKYRSTQSFPSPF